MSYEAKKAVIYLATVSDSPERIADVIESEFPGEMTREQVITGARYCHSVNKKRREPTPTAAVDAEISQWNSWIGMLKRQSARARTERCKAKARRYFERVNGEVAQ